MVDIRPNLRRQVVTAMVTAEARISNHSLKAAVAANLQTAIRAAQASQAHRAQAVAAVIHTAPNIIVHIMAQPHLLCTHMRTVYFQCFMCLMCQFMQLI